MGTKNRAPQSGDDRQNPGNFDIQVGSGGFSASACIKSEAKIVRAKKNNFTLPKIQGRDLPLQDHTHWGLSNGQGAFRTRPHVGQRAATIKSDNPTLGTCGLSVRRAVFWLMWVAKDPHSQNSIAIRATKARQTRMPRNLPSRRAKRFVFMPVEYAFARSSG